MWSPRSLKRTNWAKESTLVRVTCSLISVITREQTCHIFNLHGTGTMARLVTMHHLGCNSLILIFKALCSKGKLFLLSWKNNDNVTSSKSSDSHTHHLSQHKLLANCVGFSSSQRLKLGLEAQCKAVGQTRGMKAAEGKMKGNCMKKG